MAPKNCPVCKNTLRRYSVEGPTPVRRFLPGYVLGEITLWIVGGTLAAFEFWGWASGVAAGAIVMWLVWRPSKREAEAGFSRYYCDKCQNHFEGDALRRLTTNAI